METFEARIKEWMRYKPHSRYKIYMPEWRNKQWILTSNIETYLIRSGGVTEKDTVKLINTSSGTLFIVDISDKTNYHLFQRFGLVAQLVRAPDS